jgi:hypothetical protein
MARPDGAPDGAGGAAPKKRPARASPMSAAAAAAARSYAEPLKLSCGKAPASALGVGIVSVSGVACASAPYGGALAPKPTARPPAAADMSFLTIGSDLIDEDLTVTWPA